MQEGILNVKEQESFALYFTYNLLKKHEFQPLGKHVRSYFLFHGHVQINIASHFWGLINLEMQKYSKRVTFSKDTGIFKNVY